MRIEFTEKEVDLLIRLLDEEIDDMVYFNYSTARTKNTINKFKTMLQIFKEAGGIVFSDDQEGTDHED